MLDLHEEARSIIQILSQPTAEFPVAAAPWLRAREIEVLTRALAVQIRNLAGLANSEEDAGAIEEVRRIKPLDFPVSPTPASNVDLKVLAHALYINTQLLVALSSIGECRRAVPYAGMRPVIKEDGTRVWCCGHTPEHCA